MKRSARASRAQRAASARRPPAAAMTAACRKRRASRVPSASARSSSYGGGALTGGGQRPGERVEREDVATFVVLVRASARAFSTPLPRVARKSESVRGSARSPVVVSSRSTVALHRSPLSARSASASTHWYSGSGFSCGRRSQSSASAGRRGQQRAPADEHRRGVILHVPQRRLRRPLHRRSPAALQLVVSRGAYRPMRPTRDRAGWPIDRVADQIDRAVEIALQPAQVRGPRVRLVERLEIDHLLVRVRRLADPALLHQHVAEKPVVEHSATDRDEPGAAVSASRKRWSWCRTCPRRRSTAGSPGCSASMHSAAFSATA